MTNLTTIQLIGNVQGYLDLDDTTILPLNFAVSDIRDISSRTGSFSKSIKVKGTKNNNKLLNHYFDVNIDAGSFDINRKQSCIVLQNGVTVFDNAIIQLISVTKIESTNRYDDQVEYTLLIKDTTSDFFTIINNKYLEDLNLNIQDHTMNATNIVASFNNNYEQGYKYMLSFNPSDGLTTETELNNNKYVLSEFKPGIYVRRYFDRIFMEATGNTGGAGYKYSFPSMSSDTINFDKLIIPYNGDEKLTDDDFILNYNTSFSGGTSQISTNTYNQYGTNFFIKEIPYKKLTMGTEISDPDNLYNPSTSIYTTPNTPADTAVSKFQINITYRIYVQNNTSNTVTVDTQGYSVKIEPKFLIQGIPFPLKASPITIPNGQSYNSSPQTTLFSSAATLNLSIDNLPNNKALEFAVKSLIWQKSTDSSDDTNRLRFLDNSAQITQGATFRMEVTSVSVSVNSTINTDFGYNSVIKLNKFIPRKIKQSDFIKGLFGMFNLYAEVDRNDPQLINISRRDEYYDSGTVVDWTKKIVKDEEKELSFLPLLTNKKLVLTYKQDNDEANKIYLEATGEVYGQQEFIFNNEYVKDIDKKEFVFSPTPMYNTKFNAIVPLLIGGAPKCNIRILMDGGNYTCGEYSIKNYDGETTNLSATTYPHISHWNHPTSATFDLNFGVCDFYYRTDGFKNTNNNLFNLHWRRTMNQINSGKMLIANFVLNEIDVANMRLNDKIFINNSYWNINKVIDYNANSNQPTKVELISIDDTLLMPFTARTVKKVSNSSPPVWQALTGLINLRNPFVNTIQSPTTFVRGFGNWISPEAGTSTVVGNGNTILDGISTVNGNGNILTRGGGLVFGSNNVVDDEFATVFGSGNVIPSGITRAWILGNGITADTSDSVYVPNIIISPGGTINGVQASAITVVQTLQTVTNNGNTTTQPITANAFIKTGGLSTQFLMADGSISTSSGGSGSISGAGTTNTIAKFGSTSAVTNSSITDDGSLVLIGINTRVIGTLTANTFVRSGGTSTQFLKGDGSVDTKTYITGYTETDTLQNVTDRGNTTTQNITANSFIKSGGLSTQFLKANGTVDSNTYLTSFTETDTLGTVSARGANAGTTISATSFVKVGGTSSQFLKADGSSDSNTYLAAEVDTLQTVTSRGNGTSLSIQALSFIKTAGLSSQFLKADGSSDSNVYITNANDIFVTGGTYSNGTAIFTNRTGGTFNVTGFFTSANDVFVTGGTYNNPTGTLTFTNRTGGTFTVNGLFTGFTEVDTLQSVTTRGSATTTNIQALAFIKSGGTSSQFLKANGSVDSNVYALDSSVIHTTGNESKAGNLTLLNDLVLSGLTLFTGSATNLGVDSTGKVVSVPIDETLVITVRNTTGVSIAKGQVVYINGSSGSRATIALAQATSSVTTSLAVGVTNQSIANNATGFVTVAGQLTGLDTSAFVGGDRVYLSPTIAGGLTTTIPVTPDNVIFIGTISNAHAIQGSIVVNILYTFRIDKLADVLTTGVTNGQVLTYESSTGLWRNRPAISGGTTNTVAKWNSSTGITNSNITDTGSLITFNGATLATDGFTAVTITKSGGTSSQYLMADGSVSTLSSVGSITGSGTLNFIPKFSSTSAISNSIIYVTGTSIGINTTTPQAILDVEGGITVSASTAYFTRGFHDPNFRVGFRNGTGTTLNSEQGALVYDFTLPGLVNTLAKIGFHRGGTADCTAITFGLGVGSNSMAEAGRFTGNRNLLLGTTADTVTDKLQVNGSTNTTFLKVGTGTFIGATAEIVTNNAVTFADQTLVVQNTNANQMSGVVARDNTGGKFITMGVAGSATTLGGTYGLPGEGVIRASTSATSLSLIAVNGAIKFSNGLSAIERMRIETTGNILIGTTADTTTDRLQVSGTIKTSSSVQVGDNVGVASASNAGALRYRTDANNSYVDMSMQTGTSVYGWVNIIRNNY